MQRAHFTNYRLFNGNIVEEDRHTWEGREAGVALSRLSSVPSVVAASLEFGNVYLKVSQASAPTGNAGVTQEADVQQQYSRNSGMGINR